MESFFVKASRAIPALHLPRLVVYAALPVLLGVLLCCPSARAATPGPSWSITSVANPTSFSTTDPDEVQQVEVSATGGTFALSLGSTGTTTTGAIAYDAPASTVQSGLEHLTSVGAGDVTVTGGPGGAAGEPARYVITFVGALQEKAVALLSANGTSLTGANQGAYVSRLIEGGPLPTPVGSSHTLHDVYTLVVTNIGSVPSSGLVRVKDTLPAGLVATKIEGAALEEAGSGNYPQLSCTLATLECVTTAQLSSVASFHSLVVNIAVKPISAVTATVTNSASVEGGGAFMPASTEASPNTINSPTVAPFGVLDFAFGAGGVNGAPDALAGDHPYTVTASLDTPTMPTRIAHGEAYVRVQEAKDIVTELPLGLVGTPAAALECTLVQAEYTPTANVCPRGSEVGYIVFEGSVVGNPHGTTGEVAGQEGDSPIYNVAPEQGYPAEFVVDVLGLPVHLYAAVVHTKRGYMLRVLVPGFLRSNGIRFETLIFFGDPSAVNGSGGPAEPFFTYPSDCAAEVDSLRAVIHEDSWQNPAPVKLNSDGSPDLSAATFEEPGWVTEESLAPLPTPTGCGLLAPLFTPSFEMAPSKGSEEGSSQADSPSAYSVSLEVPQSNNPTAEHPVFDKNFDETPGTPPVKDVTVTLPAGVSVSPSAAAGLESCSEAQEQLDSNESAECPAASKIGTAEVTTPLLGTHNLDIESPDYGEVTGAEVIHGSLYVVKPSAQDLSLEGKGNGHFPLMIELKDAERGIDIKLQGEAEANEKTGQLTARFDENPQLPVTQLKLHVDGGEGGRAPLANPQECGSYTTSTEVSSWAEEPGDPGANVASSQNSFQITGCGASLPFAPGFSAGTLSPVAGSYSPFTLSFSRNDGEQDLGGITVNTPPGLLGKIAGVPRCGEAEANAGTCSEASQIGTTTVTAGPGSHPYTVTGGRVYLTGPYKGAPFGLSVVVPAVAGPFNLGDVVVRAAIAVNPSTAALTITSDALPQIRDGVPFRLRTVNVEVNKPGFMLNATDCAVQSISASVSGEHPLGSSEAGKSSAVSSAYAASGCANLAFKPSLTASTQGHASKADGASLTIKVEQKTGEANIHKVDLTLPKALPARLTTLQKACTEAQFNANPAGCPQASNIGTATAVTPLLSVPLEGPAYLVSHGGAAFPDVEFVLQGEGVEIVLDGKTNIKKGVTYSKFETVPDAPISSFETVLSEGLHSILGTDIPASAKYSLCGQKLVVPTTVTGQNGGQVVQQTKVAVTGCAKAKALTRAQKLAKALKTCRKKKNKHKRAKCEKQARKRYGPVGKKGKRAEKSDHGRGRK